jgi:hypothetical protein
MQEEITTLLTGKEMTAINVSITEMDKRINQRFIDLDIRYEQRFASIIKSADDAGDSNQLNIKTAADSTEKALSKASETSDKAIIKLDITNEKKFDALNEFRNEAIKNISKLEAFMIQVQSIISNDGLVKTDHNTNRTSNIATIGIIISALALLAVAYGVLHKP